ncbi:cytochrome P450 [Modestobacter sp. VKM Ac-2983]|uniref:cytochrome P450 n=1 Tax=Modestobacter sp. VKM Ac-2983 TaxID=3004137 RepID=UPI0022AB9581|nr:cytochrome P450 [Modestobacter sp. VKM Ac-2983]MCZ2803542.1 cytochrome P450 [Modestobacter sp. VKM Ac-2983]
MTTGEAAVATGPTAPGPVDWFPLQLPGVPAGPAAARAAALAGKRARTPVEPMAAFGEDGAVWTVYRYDDAAAVLADDARFSLGVVEERYGAVLGRSVLTVAPRARRALRRVLATHLHPDDPAVAELVESVVTERVAALAPAADGPVDLVPLLAAQVPARVLVRLLGLPGEEWAAVAGLASAAAGFLSDPRGAIRAARALRRSFAGRLHATGPGDDVVTALARVEVDGERLAEAEVVASLLLLAWAGTETAHPAVLTCLYAVLAHPGVASAVRADPALALAAVDEALRWEAPVQVTSRRAERATRIGDTVVPAGATVLVHLGSANRDERRFADPDRFDLARSGSPGHLAFGTGVHRCLGWQLARTEVAACVRVLLDRWPDLRLAEDSPPPEGAVLRSPRRLLVHLR